MNLLTAMREIAGLAQDPDELTTDLVEDRLRRIQEIASNALLHEKTVYMGPTSHLENTPEGRLKGYLDLYFSDRKHTPSDEVIDNHLDDIGGAEQLDKELFGVIDAPSDEDGFKVVEWWGGGGPGGGWSREQVAHYRRRFKK